MKPDFLKALGQGVLGMAVLVGLAYVVLGMTGCGGKSQPPQPHVAPVPQKSKFDLRQPPPPGWKSDLDREDDSSPQNLDFTGLRGVLTGKWEKKSGSKAEHILEFTEKSIERMERNQFSDGGYMRNTGKCAIKDDVLLITDEDGRTISYGFEFLSDGEIILRPEKLPKGFKEYYGNHFSSLHGQWRRVSLPPGKQTPLLGTGPIADAKRQVRRIEQKAAKVEKLLQAAIADRDELVKKLRSVGVNSTADLKGNVRGQRLAQGIAKLATEIDALERQLASIESEVLKGKTIVRRMEREQASIPDDEMRKLNEQLREAEERTDGAAPAPITPLDVEAALDKALNRKR